MDQYLSLAQSQLKHVLLFLGYEAQQEIQFCRMLDLMHGIFPPDLLNLLDEEDRQRIHFEDHGFSVSPRIIGGWKLLSKMASLPPEHLVNYEWRFTPESAIRIGEEITKLSLNKNERVCCLGTPTVAMELIRRGYGKNVVLIDINEPLISRMNARFSDTGFLGIVHDIQYQIPRELQDRFSLVVIDPPWYLDYYRLFFSRAIQLLRPESNKVLSTIFPILSRHSALKDRKVLISELRRSGLIRTNCSLKVRFETPEFEKAVFNSQNIKGVPHNWRSTDMMFFQFSHNTQPVISTDFIIEPEMWNRCVIDNQYLAIREGVRSTALNQDAYHNSACVLDHMDNSSRLLSTVGRKRTMRREIFAWDSNNQILDVSTFVEIGTLKPRYHVVRNHPGI